MSANNVTMEEYVSVVYFHLSQLFLAAIQLVQSLWQGAKDLRTCFDGLDTYADFLCFQRLGFVGNDKEQVRRRC